MVWNVNEWKGIHVIISRFCYRRGIHVFNYGEAFVTNSLLDLKLIVIFICIPIDMVGIAK